LGGPVGVSSNRSADRHPLPALKAHRTGRLCERSKLVKRGLRIAMDRATLKRNLLDAKARVALTNEHIDRQRELIEMLRKRRLDTTEARRNLSTLEARHAEFLAEVERLTAELVLRTVPHGPSPGASKSGK
jgi:hypothetical protein